jgi:hypothetical protein
MRDPLPRSASSFIFPELKHTRAHDPAKVIAAGFQPEVS